MSLITDIRAAMADPTAVAGAREALEMVASWTESPVYRLPGCGTMERLALRIRRGATVEEAAAREYLYRWNLPLTQWLNWVATDSLADRERRRRHALSGRPSPVRMTGAWPVPHIIGM